jgi:YfiH family protein
MPFHEKDGIRYFTFDSFAPLPHAVFTRRGGVSPAPYHSLNMGGSVGDELPNVRANRISAFRALGRDPDSFFDVWQVHSADVVHTDAPRGQAQYQRADIITTDRPGVTLTMRFADCVPLLLHDPRKGVIAAAHAGWLGTVRDVPGAAVASLQARYGSNPQDVRVAIGPSIGPDHYEIGEDVIQHVRQAFGKHADDLLEPRGMRVHFNLWAANRFLLDRAGVGQIENAEICTACHLEDWFSHRAEKGRTGRFGMILALS